MIRPLAALTINGFREARRNRVSAVVAMFAVVSLLGATLVTEVTVYTMYRVLTDFGLGTMSLTLTVLAVFLSSSQLVREIERRTIFLIVSKPVSRTTFIVGRFLGTMLTLLVLLAVMGAVLLGQVALYGAPISSALIAGIVMLWFELLILAAVGFLLSSFAGQVVSAMVTAGLFFAGHLAEDIYTLSQRSDSDALRVLGKSIYYVLPHLDRVNYRPQAAYQQEILWSELGTAMVYAVAYAAVCVTLATLIFARRDFK